MSITHKSGIVVKVELQFAAGLVDVSADVRFMSMQSSQRARLSNTFDPGRLVLQLDNKTRKYDPLYAAGPYFSFLRAGRGAQVTITHASAARTDATWYGETDRFALDYDKSNKDSVVTLTCVDALSRLSLGVVYAGYDVETDLEVGTIFGQPTSGPLGRAYVLQGAAGNATPTPAYPPGLSGFSSAIMTYDWDITKDHNMLDEYRRIADIEQAPLTSSFTGTVYFWPRHWFKQNTTSATSQLTVGNGGMPFQNVQVLFDSDEIITACSMTNERGDAVVSINTAGEATYGRRWPSVTYSELPCESEILNGASQTVVELRSTEEFRIDQIVIKPQSNTGWLNHGIDLQLLDRITVAFTPTKTGSAISEDYFIDGITHDVSPDDWTLTYSLMPANRFDDALPGSLFIVDSSLVDGAHLVGF